MDVPLGGRRFTWVNNAATKMMRIDRVLVSMNVMSIFGDTKLIALPRGASDHLPLLFHNEVVDFGPTPFKLFHSWVNYPDFHQIITEDINNPHYLSLGSFHDKLRYLKVILKNANLVTDEELIEKQVISVELDKILKIEDADTLQKARIK
ncbi:uncharacterized protein [Rutidosis leptorrhynchoides]|uniref:uncharacterized protein n=1 Tax=Rutidosis leptorrhynchoides TaxID=125765 RepID=UPI003A99179C